MKLSKMSKKQACKAMLQLIPYIDEIREHESTKAMKRMGDKARQDGTTIDVFKCIEVLAPAVLETDIEDRIVAAMTGKSLDELQEMPLEEYLAALNEFDMAEVINFFTWWVSAARAV